MPVALLALTAGAFGIGVTEFVLMGLLLETSADLHVTVAQAGLLISGYAFGVVLGAPVLTTLTARWPRKACCWGSWSSSRWATRLVRWHPTTPC